MSKSSANSDENDDNWKDLNGNAPTCLVGFRIRSGSAFRAHYGLAFLAAEELTNSYSQQLAFPFVQFISFHILQVEPDGISNSRAMNIQ